MVYDLLGILKYELKNYEEAMAATNEAIKLDPKFCEPYFYRGLCKIELGYKDEGLLDLSKAGELGDKRAFEEIKKNR